MSTIVSSMPRFTSSPSSFTVCHSMELKCGNRRRAKGLPKQMRFARLRKQGGLWLTQPKRFEFHAIKSHHAENAHQLGDGKRMRFDMLRSTTVAKTCAPPAGVGFWVEIAQEHGTVRFGHSS